MDIIAKLKEYKKRPHMIKFELVSSYNKFVFKLQNYIDPIPNELIDDYSLFDKVDPKYGLRYYGYLKKGNRHTDLATSIKYIDYTYKRARDRKLLKRLAFVIVKLEQRYDEGYQRYLTRSKILKDQF